MASEAACRSDADAGRDRSRFLFSAALFRGARPKNPIGAPSSTISSTIGRMTTITPMSISCARVPPLGRVIRDIERRIVGKEDLREAFVRPLYLARRVLEQERRQRGRKVYSLHAPEVECIGKGKAHRLFCFWPSADTDPPGLPLGT